MCVVGMAPHLHFQMWRPQGWVVGPFVAERDKVRLSDIGSRRATLGLFWRSCYGSVPSSNLAVSLPGYLRQNQCFSALDLKYILLSYSRPSLLSPESNYVHRCGKGWLCRLRKDRLGAVGGLRMVRSLVESAPSRSQRDAGPAKGKSS